MLQHHMQSYNTGKTHDARASMLSSLAISAGLSFRSDFLGFNLWHFLELAFEDFSPGSLASSSSLSLNGFSL